MQAMQLDYCQGRLGQGGSPSSSRPYGSGEDLPAAQLRYGQGYGMEPTAECWPRPEGDALGVDPGHVSVGVRSGGIATADLRLIEEGLQVVLETVVGLRDEIANVRNRQGLLNVARPCFEWQSRLCQPSTQASAACTTTQLESQSLDGVQTPSPGGVLNVNPGMVAMPLSTRLDEASRKRQRVQDDGF